VLDEVRDREPHVAASTALLAHIEPGRMRGFLTAQAQ
jgi:hypothetical protein